MKRIFLGLLSLTLAVTAFAQKEVVKIGAIYSMTGPLAFIGEQMRDGAQMRLAEQESKDALFDYEYILEDDAGKSAQSVLAYKKQTSVNNCEVIFNVWAGPGNAIAPLAAKDKKLVFACAWDDRIADDPLAFIHLTPPAPQAKKLAETLHELGIKKVAVLCLVQQGFMAMEKAFSEEALVLGLECQTLKFNPGERDFRTHLLKLREFNPEAYVVLSLQPEFEIVVNRIRETDPDKILTAVEGFTYLKDMTPFNGCFLVEGNYPTDEFKKQFLTWKGSMPVGFVGNGYDMVDFTIYAYETAGARLGRKPTTSEAAEVLSGVKDYPSAVGSVSMDEKGVVVSPAVLKIIENGQAKVVELGELKSRLGK